MYINIEIMQIYIFYRYILLTFSWFDNEFGIIDDVIDGIYEHMYVESLF